MKKIEAIIRPGKLEELKAKLNQMEVRGMTVYHVMGRGLQQEVKQYYRGQEVSVDLFPKVKVEVICRDHWLERIVEPSWRPAVPGQSVTAKYLSTRWRRLYASAAVSAAMQLCNTAFRYLSWMSAWTQHISCAKPHSGQRGPR